MFRSASEFTDVVSVLAFCSDDNSYLLANIMSPTEFWLPSIKVEAGSWYATYLKCINEVFGVNEAIPTKVLKLYKIWVPNLNANYVYHCVYEIRVNQEIKKKSKNIAGKYRGKTRWFTEMELSKMDGNETLKSWEILDLVASTRGPLRSTPEGGEGLMPQEFTTAGVLVELYETKIITLPGASIFAQLLDAAGFNKDVQAMMYRHFLYLCYPAIYMGQAAFTVFAGDIGWPKDEIQFLFKAADLNNRNSISFLEFSYIFAATEPNTSHGGAPAELRCRYMFRFYDRDKDSILNYNEFKTLITAVRKSKKQTLDMVSVAQEAEEGYKSMGMKPDSSITIAEFLHAVGDLKLRGTSQVFRSPVSVVQRIKTLSQDPKRSSPPPTAPPSKMNLENSNIKVVKPNPSPVPQTTANKGKTLTVPYNQSGKPFEIALHTIQLQRSGTIIDVEQIFSIENALTQSSMQNPTIKGMNRKISEDFFNQKSLPNEVLKGLRYLSQLNAKTIGKPTARKTPPKDYVWGQLDPMQFARNIINLSHSARDIFKEEPRLIELSSPCYVMGDFHGNFHDLLHFEKVLWNLGPGLCPSTLLFLGDYVDRGDYSVEVASYLFSYKIQAPAKVRLLRGNHEIRDIQKMFTFYTECCSKFGEAVGKDVWNAINNAFDCMPLSAIIDTKIFCCHGGIPPPWLCPMVHAINAIPAMLSQPDDQSSLAWDIMWNDPIRPKQMNESVAMELTANEGFATNTRRGTAHVWNSEALERFLTVNGLTHVIRAHEVAQAGFHLQQKGKLFTVFSSSKYCGSANDAACIFVDQGKLRIMKLDTS